METQAEYKVTSLRDAAMQALAEDTARHRKSETELYSEQTRRAFVEQFGREPDNVIGEHVLIDGMDLCYGGDLAWSILWRCDNCGKQYSSPFHMTSLTAMGAAIRDLEYLTGRHYCVGRSLVDLQKRLEAAARAVESGPVCEAELRINLTIAASLVDIVRQLEAR